MCGIVGYVGNKKAVPFLVNGLKKLEYRGYDSAGVAVYDSVKWNIDVVKAKGRITKLEEKLKDSDLEGTVGIGHTRWATHGEPNDINAHPHVSYREIITVVHNGIIENYLRLKEYLESKGYHFNTDTDTEVLANIIDYYYKGDIFEAVTEALRKVEGSYAIGVLCKDFPNQILCVRKDSPLIIGLGNEENYIASDIPAILEHTKKIYILEDNEFAIVKKDSVKIVNEDKELIPKDVFEVDWDVAAAEKSGFEHFMIKEIFEQPKAIKNTISPRVQNDKIVFDNIELTKEELQGYEKIYIVACGTAYYAGVAGKYVIEKLLCKPVEVDIASEFRYREPIINEKTLMFIISQSGETADTLAALREGKVKGAKVISVVNVVGSTIARESDNVIYTLAGPEIAVASTKAYTTQLTSLYLIAIYMAKILETISDDAYRGLVEELRDLPLKVEKILENKEKIQKLASKHHNARDAFYIGRGLDFAVSLEGALKLKEISYIHSEGYAAGELKHGPIALIENGTLVIALATQKYLYDKVTSNIKEINARGANVFAITLEGNEEILKAADDVLYLPYTNELFTSVLAVIPLQLFAYYVAVAKGCDVDKPRNLAKSVTVE